MTNTTMQPESLDGDVYSYVGAIDRDGYAKLTKAIDARKKKRDKAYLVLATFGGCPHSAFRIARALRCNYKKLDVIVPTMCKSAGTLVCIGADRLVIGDSGELGPLDVQLLMPDEIDERISGLAMYQAMTYLIGLKQIAFIACLNNIKQNSRIRAKSAAEIASKMATDYVAPIVEKIDPLTIGEYARALSIGSAYGNRLNEMSKILAGPDSMQLIVGDYPSHSFVIDRKEARNLFVPERVIAPSSHVHIILDANFRGSVDLGLSPNVGDLTSGLEQILLSYPPHTKNDSTNPTAATHTNGGIDQPIPDSQVIGSKPDCIQSN